MLAHSYCTLIFQSLTFRVRLFPIQQTYFSFIIMLMLPYWINRFAKNIHIYILKQNNICIFISQVVNLTTNKIRLFDSIVSVIDFGLID